MQTEEEQEQEKERHLIHRARAGDTEAFAVLCEQSRRRVWRVVASVTSGGGNADTEDLAQEAIVRAFRSLGSFRGESSFDSWLCRIALHAAHDYVKSSWRRRVTFWGHADDTALAGDASVPGTAGDNDPGDQAERREVGRRVRAAVAALGAKERVPVYLIYFEEFTLAEVARLEGIPESTVRSRVKTGLKRLERPLRDLHLPNLDDAFSVPFRAVPNPSSKSLPPPPPQTSAFAAITTDWTTS